jgi:molybdopterin/thiamine biosynthesis adenylyltransferase
LINRIVKYLHSQGYTATIENNKIITTHQCGPQNFSIAGDINSEFPRKLPNFYLRERNRHGALAHVGWNNNNSKDEWIICEGVSINRNIDFSQPELVYLRALNNAVDVITTDLSDTRKNDAEIIKEFTAHWRFAAQSKNDEVISFIEPQGGIEEIAVYIPRVLSSKNNTFLIKDNNARINNEYLFLRKLIKNSQLVGKAIYLPIDSPFLPPNPTQKIFDWWYDVLKEQPKNIQDKLKDIARRNHSRDFWVLGSVDLQNDSLGWFCIKFSATCKSIPPLFIDCEKGQWEATAYEVNIHSKVHIVPRGGASSHDNITIAIIGCGSVGSEVARQLASAGLENILLVDYDVLEIENVYRHFLNAENIGEEKRTALAFDLKKRYPYVNATVMPQKTLESCLDSSFLSGVDGIICATGSPTEERYFNEQLFKLDKRPWVIYNWVEGHGVGGHAIYVHKAGKGCLNCLYHDSNGQKSLETLQNFLLSQQDIAVDLSGCGSHFLPYSLTDAIQTAVLATRLALLAIENQLTNTCRISWKNEYSNSLGLETSHRFKHFNNSLNIEDLYWEDCDVCNKN